MDDSVPFRTQIDEKQAQQFFDKDIAVGLQAVRDVLSTNGGHEWSFGEFTALVDLTYQAGTRVLNSRLSPNLMKAIEDGDYEAGSKELQYTRVDGKLNPKLQDGMKRRSDLRLNMWFGYEEEK